MQSYEGVENLQFSQNSALQAWCDNSIAPPTGCVGFRSCPQIITGLKELSTYIYIRIYFEVSYTRYSSSGSR